MSVELINRDDRKVMRVCDGCGAVDDHPRHSIGTDKNQFTVKPEILEKVMANKEISDADRAQAVVDLVDSAGVQFHPDCCVNSGLVWSDPDTGEVVAVGCPNSGTPQGCDARVAAAKGKTGAGMLKAIEDNFPPSTNTVEEDE